MYHCEQSQKDGLLLLIAFKKACDSVSLLFLYSSFKLFNSGDSISSWLRLFNNEVKAYVSQCGFLSKTINIKRSCKQGDPIASYKCLLCAEILAKMLKGNKSIKGITIGENEYLMTPFADDTTLMLDGNQLYFVPLYNTHIVPIQGKQVYR